MSVETQSTFTSSHIHMRGDRETDSPRLRILFTSDYYHPHTGGGTEVVVRQLAEGLVERGHEVHVATLNTRNVASEEILAGVHIHRFKALNATRWLRYQLTLSPDFARRFDSLLRAVRPDVVNAHNVFFPTSPIALALARRRSIPTILTLHLNGPHGLKFPISAMARIYETGIGRIAALATDTMVAVGPSVAARAHTVWRLGQLPYVIPNGVDARRFVPTSDPPSEPRVLFVGRLVPNKGPLAFVEAARHLLDREVDADFWIAGDGPMRPQLELLAADYPRIHFLGERNDVPALLQQATVFTRPSTLEGFPLSVLEAMSAGVPVVVTSIPGNIDLVRHEHTGLLCTPNSGTDLADQIGRILADPQFGQTLARQAREQVLASYTWERTVERFEALVTQQLSRVAPASR